MAQGKVGRPKGGSRDTKKRILETAIPMFIKKGYENVSIDDICRKMGLTKGAFYAHYKSKDQLVLEKILAVDDYYRQEVCPQLEGLETATEKLRTFCRRVFNYMIAMDKSVIKTAYFVQIGHNDKVSAVMTEKRGLYEIVGELIAEGVEKGEFRDDLSVTMLTQVVMHNVRGVIYNWCLSTSKYDLEEAGDVMLEVLCSGLRKQE